MTVLQSHRLQVSEDIVHHYSVRLTCKPPGLLEGCFNQCHDPVRAAVRLTASRS